MEMINKRGYLKEDFRLFHIRDQVELELGYLRTFRQDE